VRKLVKVDFGEPVYQLGNLRREIMKVAAKHHADLIVMGPKRAAMTGFSPRERFDAGVYARGTFRARRS
jgi:hypothetical protein